MAGRPPQPETARLMNFSIRLNEKTAAKVKELAAKKKWSAAQTIAELVSAALEAKLIK
jgi:hypothetical protein